MLIEDDVKLDYSDVLIRPKRSTITSRKDVIMERTHEFLWSGRTWKGVPIMCANMDSVATPKMKQVLNTFQMITCPARHYLNSEGSFLFTDEVYGGQNVCMFGGLDDIETLTELSSKFNFIGLDVANGYTVRFVNAVKQLRQNNPDSIIVAGNVVTADMTQELILAGADIIKVGIGPGSVCTTRIKTGIGYPQLSAVIECADAAHGLGGHIIADGGCTSSGDIVKAFAGGADFVMLGGMLAGHEECEGEVVTKYFETGEQWFNAKDETYNPVVEKREFVKFYGMASATAMERHKNDNFYRGVEGKTVEIPFKGKVRDTIKDILSGVRSACTYMGARRLKDISKCSTLVRVNNTHNTVYGNE